MKDQGQGNLTGLARRLLANTDDDQGESLQDVTLVAAKQLTEDPLPWVDPASAGLG